MMRKLLLIAGWVMVSTCAYSQTISYGIDAGLNLSKLPATVSVQSATVSLANNYLAGFHIGGLVDIKFNSFSIQPGVLYTTKGGKSAYSFTGNFGGLAINGAGTVKTTLNYIEVPVNFIYRVNAEKGNVFIGAGPYLGFGISGKQTSNLISGPAVFPQNQDIKFGSADGDVKNPDFGINGLVGYQLNMGFAISAGYGQGLVNSSNSQGKVKNQGFSFSAEYFFK